MLEDFKKFLLKGNVLDLAVAVIIGSAFNQIVNSMVGDVLTPLIGLLGGSPDFSSLKIGPIWIGKFINAVLNFLVVSAVIFFGIIQPMRKLQELTSKKDKKVEEPAVVVPEDIKILREILEELRRK